MRRGAATNGGFFSGTWLLSGAMVLSGILTYAFHILAARTLGAGAYGEIAVLWGAMFVAAVVLFRPLEQTTSRAIADRLARGEEARTVVRTVVLLGTAVLVGALGIAAAAGWGALANGLFAGSDLLTAMLLLGVAVYGASYIVRGLLAGVRWFPGYGIGLVADGVGRLLVALPLVVVASRGLAAAAMVAAGLVSAAIPLALGRHRLREALRAGEGREFRTRQALGFAGPASVIAAADQLLVNGSPLLVVIAGGAKAHAVAGVVLAATMLVRAPVYVFQGVAASLLPNFTHLQAVAERRRFRQALRRASLPLLGAAALITAGTALVGPQTLALLYGAGFHAGRGELTLLAAGVGGYLVAATFSQALLALDCGGRAAWAWTLAGALFVGLYPALPGSALMRISVAFFVAATAGAAATTLLVARRVGGAPSTTAIPPLRAEIAETA